MTDEAKVARAQYMREWRKRNPGKQKEYDARKWERKAEREAETKEQITAHRGRPAKYSQPMERLNLKIPVDVKEYLYAAAYRASSSKKQVSVTEYLCKIVREDMERHGFVPDVTD